MGTAEHGNFPEAARVPADKPLGGGTEMESLKITREKRGDWDVVRLIGPINEEAGIHFIRLYSDSGDKVVFNFRDVTVVNSNGLRAWVLFFRDFKTDRDIELEECSPTIVDQMNMLPSFTQKAVVRSIYLPFECEDCKLVSNVFIEARDFPEAGKQLKPGRCKKCHGPTRPADAGDSFSFLR